MKYNTRWPALQKDAMVQKHYTKASNITEEQTTKWTYLPIPCLAKESAHTLADYLTQNQNLTFLNQK